MNSANGVEGRRYTATILEERHMISILLYLKDNEGCKKTDLYNAIAGNVRMSDKLDMLESAGLLRQERTDGSRAVRLSLTDAGFAVEKELRVIEQAIVQASSNNG